MDAIAIAEHLNKLAPGPMSLAIEKEVRFAAIEKHFAHKLAVTVLVPPSTSGNKFSLFEQ